MLLTFRNQPGPAVPKESPLTPLPLPPCPDQKVDVTDSTRQKFKLSFLPHVSTLQRQNLKKLL